MNTTGLGATGTRLDQKDIFVFCILKTHLKISV